MNCYNQNGEVWQNIPWCIVMYKPYYAWILPGICWRHLVAWRSQESARPLINLIGPPLLTDGYSAIQAESTSHSIYGCGAGLWRVGPGFVLAAACSCTHKHWFVKCFRLVMYATSTHTASPFRDALQPWHYRHHYAHLTVLTYLSWNKWPTEVWSVVWGDLLSSAL